MGKRLYWGRVLRSVAYFAAYKGHNAKFAITLEKIIYDEIPEGQRKFPQTVQFQAPTLDDLYQQLKEAGYQIWGKNDYLNYAYHPRTAFEYLLITDVLKSQGYTQEIIDKMFRLE